MASSSSNDPQQQQQQQQQEKQENETGNSEKLALPAAPEEGSNAPQRIDLSGGQDSSTTVSLDHLGPIVVNQDGTMSRISNWDKMTEMEQKNTLRIIGKRNKQRLEALKKTGGGGLEEGSA